MNKKTQSDLSDLLFRLFFSTIFLGLGAEHIFKDEIIQFLMPDWIPLKRLASLFAGTLLLTGGTLILLGYKLRFAAILLGIFVITVTAIVHAPALMTSPTGLPNEWEWLWQVFQRSNFVKNLCLLGVCFHLLEHCPGRFSLEHFLKRSKE